MVPANSPVTDGRLGAPHAVQVIGQPSCWSVGMTNADNIIQSRNHGIQRERLLDDARRRRSTASVSHHSRRPHGGGVSSTFHCV